MIAGADNTYPCRRCSIPGPSPARQFAAPEFAAPEFAAPARRAERPIALCGSARRCSAPAREAALGWDKQAPSGAPHYRHVSMGLNGEDGMPKLALDHFRAHTA